MKVLNSNSVILVEYKDSIVKADVHEDGGGFDLDCIHGPADDKDVMEVGKYLVDLVSKAVEHEKSSE